jgi:hypothetical protein
MNELINRTDAERMNDKSLSFTHHIHTNSLPSIYNSASYFVTRVPHVAIPRLASKLLA